MTDRPIIFSATTVNRFWSFVERHGDDDCWEWRGPLNAKGYGRFHANGASEMAHRTAVRLDGRDIPPGLEVDHKCRVRCCVNPAHLRVVTHRVNLLAGNTITAIAAAKTLCPAGHPLNGENLVHRSGKRACRECDRLRAIAAYQPTTSRRRRAHLTKAEVSEIRALITVGQSHTQIAEAMELSIATISNVRNGRGNYGR